MQPILSAEVLLRNFRESVPNLIDVSDIRNNIYVFVTQEENIFVLNLTECTFKYLLISSYNVLLRILELGLFSLNILSLRKPPCEPHKLF